MDTYNSSVLRARLSLRMRILHACSGIITISACVLRIRDYYFSGELASFPLLCPYERSMEKNKSLIYKEKSEIDRLFRGRNAFSSVKMCGERLPERFVGIHSTTPFFIYNALQSRTREADTFQQKNKNRKGKKRIWEKAFTSRPMNRRNLEDFSFRFRTRHLLTATPSKFRIK